MLIKHGMNQLSGTRNCTVVSSAVLRRQHFLIRSLGGYNIENRMQETKSVSGNNLEADAQSIMRAIIPTLDPSRYKGQAGKLIN